MAKELTSDLLQTCHCSVSSFSVCLSPCRVGDSAEIAYLCVCVCVRLLALTSAAALVLALEIAAAAATAVLVVGLLSVLVLL